MAVKFPLKMADGAMVRTLEDLRDHFDLTTVLAYYDNGRLTKWLENGYYDEEAAEVAALNPASENFVKELCSILGVDGLVSEAAPVDMGVISRRNERLRLLKQYTADNGILDAVDHVAFSQEELVELLNQGVTVVYLFGEQFTIPEGFEEVPYRCVNNPVVKLGKLIRLESSAGQGDIDARVELGDYYAERNDPDTAAKWYLQAVEKITSEGLAAQPDLKDKLADLENKLRVQGKGPEVIGLYTSVAEEGNVWAQVRLADRYMGGLDVERNQDKALEWYKKAADQGDVATQYKLGSHYYSAASTVKRKRRGPYYEEAVKWFRMAADQGLAEAQYQLGRCYLFACGVMYDYDMGIKLHRLAAEQGYSEASYNLGSYYALGHYGLKRDIAEAIKWYRLAAQQDDSYYSDCAKEVLKGMGVKVDDQPEGATSTGML